MRALVTIFLVASVIQLFPATTYSKVPNHMSIQGRLTDSSGIPLSDVTRTLTLRIFDMKTGGSEIWPGGPGEVHSVTTTGGGLWTADAGATLPLVEAVFSDTTRWLEITVDDGINSPVTLPRVRLVTSPYAFRADQAEHATRADTADIAFAAITDDDWTVDNNFIATAGQRGIQKGGSENVHFGDSGRTIVNLGIACTTGVDGFHQPGMTIGGGIGNVAGGKYSVIGGGLLNSSSGDSSAIGGGIKNTASGPDATVGGGRLNVASGTHATVAGGNRNTASDVYAFVGGGNTNTAGANEAVVGGGRENYAGFRAFVGGGESDSAIGSYSAVSGGFQNTTTGGSSSIGGGGSNRASGDYAAVHGGLLNNASGDSSTIGGGSANIASGPSATVGGGRYNTASGTHATVAGGNRNTASDIYAFVGGGNTCTAAANEAVVGGGRDNYAGFRAFVGGGQSDSAIGNYSAVVGGFGNRATGGSSTVAGGGSNLASGDYSFAAGRRAKAVHQGSYVWADAQDADYESTMENQLSIRAANGVRIDSDTDSTAARIQNHGSGCALYVEAHSPSNVAAGTFINTGTGPALSVSTPGSIVGPVASFLGDVSVSGTLNKGSGSFKIDHPLDPENKYLYHSFVESPDMMNMYNGNVMLDANGEATVVLPSYFDALNRDFRYQLTAIGAPGPNLYIAKKISGNQFSIAGGVAGMEVSWLVTGIRHDAYANAHRIDVEEEKPLAERGLYLHPEALGQPASMGVYYEMARGVGENEKMAADR